MLRPSDSKFKLLIKGQEWVAKQIRYNRELINVSSTVFLMEAVKIQHEENVDMMKQLLQIKTP
jgi:hypothetical protein